MTVRGVDLPKKPAVWLGDDGIVYNDLSGFRHLTLDMVRYLHNERLRLTQRSTYPLLLLAADVLTLDFEVQVYASRPDLQHWTSAMAVVGDSFMLRHLVSMYVSYHPPSYPLQLFSELQPAREWLLRQPSAEQATE